MGRDFYLPLYTTIHFGPYQVKGLHMFHPLLAALLPPVLRLEQTFKHLLSVPKSHSLFFQEIQMINSALFS